MNLRPVVYGTSRAGSGAPLSICRSPSAVVDLLVRWPLPGGVERFAAELKVRRDKNGDLLDEGLEQLSEYLDRFDLETGMRAANG